MTVEFFRGKGVNNLLYAYSPDIQGPGQIYMNVIRATNMSIFWASTVITATTKPESNPFKIR
jgi:hypothetical protein